MLRKWFGCFFSHTGKWGPIEWENWYSYNVETSQKIEGSEYQKRVQNRTCPDCGVIERRLV